MEKSGTPSLFLVNVFYNFSTHRRLHAFLDEETREEVTRLLKHACDQGGFEMLAAGVVSDHVYLLVRQGALCKPNEVMWRLKGGVAKAFFEKHPDFRGPLATVSGLAAHDGNASAPNPCPPSSPTAAPSTLPPAKTSVGNKKRRPSQPPLSVLCGPI